MKQNITTYIKLCKDEFLKQYSTYIDMFDQKNIELRVSTEKVSYVKGFVTISFKVELVPKKAYKEKEKFWKCFAVKFMTLRECGCKKYKTLFVHRKSRIFNWFLNRHLRLTSVLPPHCLCRENLGNLFIRLLCFSRFEKFPAIYRGKNFSTILLIALLVLLAFMIGTMKSYYAWN